MDLTAHQPDGVLRALLDGELPAARRGEVDQHLATCESCRTRLRAVEHASAATGGLLAALTPPPVLFDAEVVIRRARSTPLRRPGPIAAAAMLLIVGVASATVARPYVRAFAARLWTAVNRAAGRSVGSEPAAQGLAGIAFMPSAEAEVALDTRQEQGVLRVSLADTTELSIRASAPVTYRVRQGGVVLHNRGSSASYDVVVPRNAPHLRIIIAGRVVLEKRGPYISTGVPSDRTGRFVISVR